MEDSNIPSRQSIDLDSVRLTALTVDLVLHGLMKLMIEARLLRYGDLNALKQEAQRAAQKYQARGSHIRDVEGTRLAAALDRFFQSFPADPPPADIH